MDLDDFAGRIAGVAALAEPVRRDLYLYVAASPEPVTRDDAAAGVGVPRHTAKFHLDRLVDDGLLAVDFKRLSGREGPGAGRPTKRYARADREIAVALPERRYDLAGEVMATAIETAAASGAPVLASLQDAAAEHGKGIGERLASRTDDSTPWDAALQALAEFGYEPRRTEEGIVMVNCPFHAIAQNHTELVCGMNLAMLESAVASSGVDAFEAQLRPTPGRCCVVLAPRY